MTSESETAMADKTNVVMVDLEGDAGTGPSAESLALQAALAEVADLRAKLATLGEPPDHETVDEARASLASIDAAFASDLERLQVSVPRYLQAQKETEMRNAVQAARIPYQAIIDTDELCRSYEVLLKAAETEMLKLSGLPEAQTPSAAFEAKTDEGESVNEEVVQVLKASKQNAIKNVDLKGHKLQRLPDAFGSISTILSLDLSNNHLRLLPDSIGGLVELQTLIVEQNDLCSLPDSIGLLTNLKFLNVSRNKLTVLPDSISMCSALETLNADLNELEYLPSQIGLGLQNIKQLSLNWNKLRSLPASLCNMKSLRSLKVKFNHLKALPQAIGNLNNLEYLDVSCNFMDLQTLPDTVGDLVALTEMDMSCNQIHTLPDSFGRLQALKKVEVKDNPLVVPPLQVAEIGTEAIVAFMKDRWQNFLEEERQRALAAEEKQQQQQGGWLPQVLDGSWLRNVFLAGSPRKASSSDDYLEQQL